MQVQEYALQPMAQAMSGGFFETGMQKLTAMMFGFWRSPQVIK